MAQAVTSFSFLTLNQNDIPIVRVVLTADPYTLGTGLTITIPPAVLLQMNSGANWVTDFPNEFLAWPQTNGTTPVTTKLATPGQINLRLWNGVTEQATGNVTVTIIIALVPIILLN
jgi:hypothetical protein